MKVREGFVSNSSSSSFIIGIGKITGDLEKVRKMIEGKYYITIISNRELANSWKINTYKDKAVMESFRGDTVVAPFNSNRDEYYLVMDYAEGDDSDFAIYAGDSFVEMDYDIDFDYFAESVQEMASLFEDCELIEDGQMTFGAGRDG